MRKSSCLHFFMCYTLVEILSKGIDNNAIRL
nr:hypothetical protein CoNPh38_CDS0372 [Staphylococcus phage S-CoN_Ph38]